MVNVVLNSLEFKETNVSGQYLSIAPENNQKSDILIFSGGIERRRSGVFLAHFKQNQQNICNSLLSSLITLNKSLLNGW